MSEGEFISELEKIMEAVELNFEPTPAFGKYRQYLEHAVAHPAKMNTNLLEFLILNFTREGETILDPMAGSGSTGVVAALHGRNAVQVDIEEKFHQWMEEARRKVEQTSTLTPKGKIVNILGDARKLSELLSQADIIITSPPYTNSAAENLNVSRYRKGGRFAEEKLLDAVITSPPYAETNVSGGDVERRVQRLISAGLDPKNYLGGRARNTVLKHYSDDRKSEDNIGNLSFGSIDAIITSPPYAESLRGNPDNQKKICETEPPPNAVRKYRRKPSGYGYSENKDNIGNLSFGDMEKIKESKGRSETYLEAMYKVYSEMYKILRPGGRAIVVVKPFIRNKRVVDLPYHTYLLMHRCGFELEKLYKLRLQTKSFWRILYCKKFPDVPRIEHEYVLVMRRPV